MDAQEFGQRLDEVEKRLERVRALYEQYFMGIEKLEPLVARKEIIRAIQLLRKERVANTALRFRFQVLIQRFTTLTAHWQRVCREIEEGTYYRHVLKAEKILAADALARRTEEAAGPSAGAASVHEISETDLQVDVVLDGLAAETPSEPGEEVATARSLADLRKLLAAAGDVEPPAKPAPPLAPDRAARPPARPPSSGAAAVPRPASGRSLPTTGPAPSPVPASAAAPGPPAARAAGLSEEKLKQVHESFASLARQGPPASVPSLGALRRSLEKEASRLGQKHPDKDIDFRVEVKDGKPVIRSFVVARRG